MGTGWALGWGGAASVSLGGFLGDSTPAKEAANFEDKSGAWRASPVAKLSLYYLQAVCHWVMSKLSESLFPDTNTH